MGRKVVIEGGLIGGEDGAYRADLVLDGEQVAAITLDASDIDADERIDAAGMLVVPGGVDVHTHFKEPAEPLLEGFAYGSRGAVAGGITTVVEMPQAGPTSSEGAHIREKRKLGETHSIVDFALWGAAINQEMAKIDEMIDEGIVAVKSFMAGSSPGFPKVTDATMVAIFERLIGTGIPYGLHAENDEMLQNGIQRMRLAGRKDPMAHAESRPPIVEEEAVNRALFLAEQTGGFAYLCHTTTTAGIAMVQAAKERGVKAAVETCPQYLTLDTDDLKERGPFARCAPAIRDRAIVEGLWRKVAAGEVDVISSDHCGYTVESREAGSDDIFEAPLGLPGVQTMEPMVLDEMLNKRGLDVGLFVRLTAANPARLFSLYPRKGSLQPGADADVVLYDTERSWTVHAKELLHKNKWTPFDGRKVGCKVTRTIIRGQTVYRGDDKAQVLAEPGYGKFLRRGYGRG
ncbi:MAG TPA: amidohydrolase family protein [Thermomicrobiaceae bacterium]|nr:amidohydrolase family protein [Thermomicrobiaceae bacterium]